MNRIVLFCLACVLSYSALADTVSAETKDLQIVQAIVRETGLENKPVYVYKTKAVEKRPVYNYMIFCLLKNMGMKEITAVTKNLNPSIEFTDKRKPVKIRLTIDERKYKGSLVVPSAADLGLVTLHPGEIAQIQLEKSSFRPLRSAMIEYEPRDHFDGRFGYWVGRTVCEPFDIKIKLEKKEAQQKH